MSLAWPRPSGDLLDLYIILIPSSPFAVVGSDPTHLSDCILNSSSQLNTSSLDQLVIFVL